MQKNEIELEAISFLNKDRISLKYTGIVGNLRDINGRSDVAKYFRLLASALSEKMEDIEFIKSEPQKSKLKRIEVLKKRVIELYDTSQKRKSERIKAECRFQIIEIQKQISDIYLSMINNG